MRLRLTVGLFLAAATALVGTALYRAADAALFSTPHWTGWTLAVVFMLLGLHGVARPKTWLPASACLLLHMHLGWIASLLFLIHAGSFPEGSNNRILWICFALALVSGAVGLGCERVCARRQQDWDALPYPRIAQERAVLAEEADAGVRNIVARGCPSLLVWFYAERLLPFLSGPAHLWSHWIGSRRPLEQILIELDHAGEDLGEDEDFVRIRELVARKANLDRRWALYWLQRGWLFLHLPAAAASTVFLVFHVVLVHAFGS